MSDYTREEVLAKIAAGESLKEANLKGINLAEAELSGADLRETNLIGADLSGANLIDADLMNANLSKANLIKTNLSEANLFEANLFEADLSYADLSGASLNEAILSGVILVEAFLFGTDLSFSNLNKANLSNAILSNAKLWLANLTSATLHNADLSSVDFERATLNEADISGANIFHIKTPGWKIDNIKCTYVYCYPYNATEEVNEKSRRNFSEGEFEAIYKFIPTIELCFRDEFNLVDELRLNDIQEKLRTEIPDTNIALRKKERVGKDMVVSLGVEDKYKVKEVAEALDRNYKDKGLEKEFIKNIDETIKKLSQSLPAISNALTGRSESNTRNTQQIILNMPITIISQTGDGHSVVSDSTVTKSAIGPGATVDFSQSYLNNQTDADKLIAELRNALTEDRKVFADQLSETLKTKDNGKAQEVWEEIKTGISTGGTIVTIADTLAKLLGLPM